MPADLADLHRAIRHWLALAEERPNHPEERQDLGLLLEPEPITCASAVNARSQIGPADQDIAGLAHAASRSLADR